MLSIFQFLVVPLSPGFREAHNELLTIQRVLATYEWGK